MHFSVGMAANDTRDPVGAPGNWYGPPGPGGQPAIEDGERNDRLHREVLDGWRAPQGLVSDAVARMDVSKMRRVARQMMVHDEVVMDTADEDIAEAVRAYDATGGFRGSRITEPAPRELVEGAARRAMDGVRGPKPLYGLRAELKAAVEQLWTAAKGEGGSVLWATDRMLAAKQRLANEIGEQAAVEAGDRMIETATGASLGRPVKWDPLLPVVRNDVPVVRSYQPHPPGYRGPAQTYDDLRAVARAVGYVVSFPVALVMAVFYWAKVVMFPAKPPGPVNATPCGTLCRHARESPTAFSFRCNANGQRDCPGARTAFRDPKDPNNCTMFERKNP